MAVLGGFCLKNVSNILQTQVIGKFVRLGAPWVPDLLVLCTLVAYILVIEVNSCLILIQFFWEKLLSAPNKSRHDLQEMKLEINLTNFLRKLLVNGVFTM